VSRQLLVAQPAPSQQRARLEVEMRRSLWVRSARGAVPMENGKAQYHCAQFMLRQPDWAVAAARREMAATGVVL